jgi:hypothetical protein
MADAKGILPHGEGIRRALLWLDERVKEAPAAPRARLVEEAAVRFDLTPLEAEFLIANWVQP